MYFKNLELIDKIFLSVYYGLFQIINITSLMIPIIHPYLVKPTGNIIERAPNVTGTKASWVIRLSIIYWYTWDSLLTPFLSLSGGPIDPICVLECLQHVVGLYCVMMQPLQSITSTLLWSTDTRTWRQCRFQVLLESTGNVWAYLEMSQ